MRARKKVVQRRYALDRRGERRRDFRVADVRDVLFAIRQHEVVNLSMEGLAHLRGGTEKSMTRPLSYTRLTENPCDSSQP